MKKIINYFKSFDKENWTWFILSVVTLLIYARLIYLSFTGGLDDPHNFIPFINKL